MTTSQTQTTTTQSTLTDFDVESFEQRLEKLKDSQEAIQQLSAWCLEQRVHHKKIIASWLNVIKKVKVEHRLILFYLANDVIQYSKRKRYEFVEGWCTALQRATTMVREEKVKKKVFRIFKIWEQRGIYSEDYLMDLNGLLSMNPPQKKVQGENEEFQNAGLISKIIECDKLSHITDKSFKSLSKPPKYQSEDIKTSLKDKTQTEQAIREVDFYIHALDKYMQNLTAEMKSRKQLINAVKKADQFYSNQHSEVKVVVTAYKSFGNRIMLVLKKLEEMTPDLPSPITTPDINAPSPEPDDDIKLPDDDQNITPMNMLKNENGFASYMDKGRLPFDINDFGSSSNQKIEVLNNRTDDHMTNFNPIEFYKPIETISSYTSNPAPIPVAAVQSEYSSLAQSQSSTAASYGSHPYQIHGNSYNSLSSTYSNEPEYGSNMVNNSYHDRTNLPLMPPPPMPSLPSLGGTQVDEFNSAWEMEMSWNSTNPFSHQNDTPLSPSSYFDREPINSSNAIECRDDPNVDLTYRQDVEHRSLHITPAIIPTLPIKKPRCVDIDHRNLISLTGSPQPSDEKPVKNPHVWVKSKELYPENDTNSNANLIFDNKEIPQDTDLRSFNFLTNSSQNDNADNKKPTTKQSPTKLPPLQPPPIFSNLNDLLKHPLPRDPPKVSTATTKKGVFKVPDQSNLKNLETTTPIKEDANYDPSECVETIDMEMSDEDFEDLFIAISKDHAQIKLEERLEQEAELKKQHDTVQPSNSQPQCETVTDSEGIYEDLWENQGQEVDQSDSYIEDVNNVPAQQHVNRWEGGGKPRNPFAGNPIEVVNINGPTQNPPQHTHQSNPTWAGSPQRMPFRPPVEIRPQQFSPRPQFPFSRNPFAGPPRNFTPPDYRQTRPRAPNTAPYFNNRGRAGGAFPGRGAINFRG